MKNVVIRVEYNQKEYTSIRKEMSDEEAARLKEAVENIAKGKGDFFKLSMDDNSVTFFPTNVLKQSIITFIAEDAPVGH